MLVKKLQFEHFFPQNSRNLKKYCTNQGLFVLIWLHFPCWIQIWQWKFEVWRFWKSQKILACRLHLTSWRGLITNHFLMMRFVHNVLLPPSQQDRCPLRQCVSVGTVYIDDTFYNVQNWKHYKWTVRILFADPRFENNVFVCTQKNSGILKNRPRTLPTLGIGLELGLG